VTAGAAIALGVALVVGAATASAVLLVAVVLVQALVVASWHRALAVPGAVGGGLVAGAAAVGADVLVLVRDDGDRPLSAVTPVLALAVLAALVQQLARRDGRPRLNASMAATVTAAALAGLASAFLAAEGSEGGAPLVAVAAVAAGLVAAGVAVRRGLGYPAAADGAVVLVAVAGGAVVAAVTDLDGLPALAVGLGCAAVAWVASVFVGRTTSPDAGLSAALPHALAGPVAYVLGRLLVG